MSTLLSSAEGVSVSLEGGGVVRFYGPRAFAIADGMTADAPTDSA